MTKLNVSGMSCGGCVKSVTKIIARTTDADSEDVKVDLDSNSAQFPDVSGDELDDLLKKLDAAGFSSSVAAN